MGTKRAPARQGRSTGGCRAENFRQGTADPAGRHAQDVPGRGGGSAVVPDVAEVLRGRPCRQLPNQTATGAAQQPKPPQVPHHNGVQVYVVLVFDFIVAIYYVVRHVAHVVYVKLPCIRAMADVAASTQDAFYLLFASWTISIAPFQVFCALRGTILMQWDAQRL